jgi:hypothetical protein
MKMTYDTALALRTAARAALSRDGFERLMAQTDRSPTLEQVCHAIEREQLTDPSTSGMPTHTL